MIAAFQRIPGAIAALDLFVTGEPRLVFGRNRVDVVGRSERGECDMLLTGAFEHAEHEVAGTRGSGSIQKSVE